MPNSSRAARRPRVLIVEDEVVLAWDLEDMLREEGYEVAGTAVSVDAALDMMGSRPVDVVVLDINLKGHLSIPLIYELRRRKVPFVVCTAYTDLLEAEQNALEGATVLKKPLSRDILVAELGRLVPDTRIAGSKPVGSGWYSGQLRSEVARLYCDD